MDRHVWLLKSLPGRRFLMIVEADKFAIDFCAAAAVANLCMNIVGKVDGGGTAGQINDVTTRV